MAQRPHLARSASADPLYKHVKHEIVRSLTEGEWKPGQLMPSEAKLAGRYSVAISTIRAALAELAMAGVVVRRQGKGTFVAIHGEEQSVYRHFHVVRNDGRKGLPVSEVVSFRKAAAEDEAADLLALPRTPAPQVFKLRNILRVGGVAIAVSDIVLPASVFGGLTVRMLGEGRILYAVYQQRFGITIVRTTEKVRSVGADAVAAKVFGMRLSEPVLEVRRGAYTFGGVPGEVGRSQFDTRTHHYAIEQGEDA